ncbi:MAG: alpha/beta hydrolase [Alphaproteobacteria bacterium]|nr:alpha/beta hydrolase [Alphaproteobacteria bacterium]
MGWVPEAQRVVAAGASPSRWAFVLHGILGSGNNWRSFCRRLVKEAPGWGFVLVDLRNHGRSSGAPPPHTVDACADDLVRLGTVEGISPACVIGHSFGGKVALRYGQRAPSPPSQLWVLDATPGAWSGASPGQTEVAQVIAALRAVPLPVPRRDALVDTLTGMGLSTMLARWMTTNLRPGEGGLVWTFDLDAVEQMLLDYLAQDAWPWLEDPARTTDVHVVRAARSDRWSPEELGRFEVIRHRLHLHVLPDAGHWLHVDNPDGLRALLLSAL